VVGFVIPLAHIALKVKVAGKDLGVFINAAILNNRAGMIDQILLNAQTVSQKENLRVETPNLHVAVKIRQVRILRDRLKEWLPAQTITKQFDKCGFAHSDITSNGNKFFMETSPIHIRM